MTPEEQRIAIAEWCGWTFPKEDGYELLWSIRPNGVEASPGPVETTEVHRYIPDYLNDLNAMHEAEEKLRLHEGYFKTGKGSGTTNVWSSYRTNLNRLLGGTWTSTVEAEIFHATAAQRAEALLRTIGKWEETK